MPLLRDFANEARVHAPRRSDGLEVAATQTTPPACRSAGLQPAGGGIGAVLGKQKLNVESNTGG
jgi:hypothetical protein